MTDAERAVREAHDTCTEERCDGAECWTQECDAHHNAIDRAIESVREETREMMAESLIMAHDDGKRDENEACAKLAAGWSVLDIYDSGAAFAGLSTAIRARISKEGE